MTDLSVSERVVTRPERNELTNLIEMLESTRRAYGTARALALKGRNQYGGQALKESICEAGCPNCFLHCAGLLLMMRDLERDARKHGAMTHNGVTYALAGRA